MTKARDVATQGGLTLITQATIGSSVTSITVNNVFSSTYDDYLIQISGGVCATNNMLRLSLGGITSGYETVSKYQLWGSTTVSGRTTSTSYFDWVGSANTTGIYAHILLQSPNLAKYKQISAPFVGNWYGGGVYQGYAGQSDGGVQNSTQATAFTITTEGATLTGGIIKVYGYKKN